MSRSLLGMARRGAPLTARYGAAVLLALACGATAPVIAATADTNAVLARIRAEGTEHSQAMEHLLYLSDVIGPRLTGSPQAKLAAKWAAEQFRSIGLENVHLERAPFGLGWSWSRSEVQLLGARARTLTALPEAWSHGTDGRIVGTAVLVSVKSTADFAAYRGKLAHKIVLLGSLPPAGATQSTPVMNLGPKDLEALRKPGTDVEDWQKPFVADLKLRSELNHFLATEHVAGTIAPSRIDGNAIGVVGYTFKPGSAPPFPRLVMAREEYGRITRLLARGMPVRLSLDVATHFERTPQFAYSVIADLPGRGSNEIVMAGAHLDSWHGGTGATDNGAGVAGLLEAARLLKSSGARPARTIRFALWEGEEEGFIGSHAYVAAHLATRPEPRDPEQRELPPILRSESPGPVSYKADAGNFSVYFNLDYGAGKIRGIYAQGIRGAIPVLESWRRPLASLGVDVVSPQRFSESDDWPFLYVGLPGFFFIQDELDYKSRTHHTNLDTPEYVRPENLIQMAVVSASFLYQAAIRPEKFPRH